MITIRPLVTGLGLLFACTVQGCGCDGDEESPASAAGVVEESAPFDPEAWTKLDSPSRPEGRDPSVLKLEDGSYRMWFRRPSPPDPMVINLSGTFALMIGGAQMNNTQFMPDDFLSRDSTHPFIATARSEDGVNWDEPVTALQGVDGEFDSRGTGSPCVLFDGTTFRMWYQGVDDSKTTRIGYAESSDGVQWERKGALFGGAPGAIDELGVGDPHVVKTDALCYRMLYTAIAGDFTIRIASAISLDGIQWAKFPLAGLEPGLSGAWDEAGVYNPSILFDGLYRLWYVGRGTVDEIPRIGYAESLDGQTWTKYPKPVLDAGATDAFDQYGVSSPFVLRETRSFRMWYAGKSLATTIGCATNP